MKKSSLIMHLGEVAVVKKAFLFLMMFLAFL